MSVFCSAKCASARTGEVVVPVPRGAPMASPPGRSQASHLRVDRFLRATGERVKALGCTSFAAVATAKDGRTAQTVMVGTDARGRPDIAGALLAIVSAVFMDPQRIRKKLAERAGVLKAKAAVEGGAAEIVRDMPAAALPALAVRVSAYLYFALPAHDLTPPSPSPIHLQAALEERQKAEAMRAELLAPPLTKLDTEIAAYNGGEDAGMLDATAATSSIKTLRKRFLKAVGSTAGLERFQAIAEKLIGGDALVKEISASHKELYERYDEWLKWPKVPLPSGGTGLSRLDAVKKLWVLAKEARACSDAFQVRVAEHQLAVSVQKVAGKRAAAAPPRDGARGAKAKAQHGTLSGSKRKRAEK